MMMIGPLCWILALHACTFCLFRNRFCYLRFNNNKKCIKAKFGVIDAMNIFRLFPCICVYPWPLSGLSKLFTKYLIQYKSSRFLFYSFLFSTHPSFKTLVFSLQCQCNNSNGATQKIRSFYFIRIYTCRAETLNQKINEKIETQQWNASIYKATKQLQQWLSLKK